MIGTKQNCTARGLITPQLHRLYRLYFLILARSFFASFKRSLLELIEFFAKVFRSASAPFLGGGGSDGAGDLAEALGAEEGGGEVRAPRPTVVGPLRGTLRFHRCATKPCESLTRGVPHAYDGSARVIQ